MDFIDILGGSGSAYRFRRWPISGAHPAIAGAFALVVEGTRQILEIGLADDLSRVRLDLDPLPTGVTLFTRLNVARHLREAEHADLAVLQAKTSRAMCDELAANV